MSPDLVVGEAFSLCGTTRAPPGKSDKLDYTRKIFFTRTAKPTPRKVRCQGHMGRIYLLQVSHVRHHFSNNIRSSCRSVRERSITQYKEQAWGMSRRFPEKKI